jgi:hypothetical protein
MVGFFYHKTHKTAKTFFMVGKQPLIPNLIRNGLLSNGDAVARRSRFSLRFCMF